MAASSDIQSGHPQKAYGGASNFLLAVKNPKVLIEAAIKVLKSSILVESPSIQKAANIALREFRKNCGNSKVHLALYLLGLTRLMHRRRLCGVQSEFITAVENDYINAKLEGDLKSVTEAHQNERHNFTIDGVRYQFVFGSINHDLGQSGCNPYDLNMYFSVSKAGQAPFGIALVWHLEDDQSKVTVTSHRENSMQVPEEVIQALKAEYSLPLMAMLKKLRAACPIFKQRCKVDRLMEIPLVGVLKKLSLEKFAIEYKGAPWEVEFQACLHQGQISDPEGLQLQVVFKAYTEESNQEEYFSYFWNLDQRTKEAMLYPTDSSIKDSFAEMESQLRAVDVKAFMRKTLTGYEQICQKLFTELNEKKRLLAQNQFEVTTERVRNFFKIRVPLLEFKIRDPLLEKYFSLENLYLPVLKKINEEDVQEDANFTQYKLSFDNIKIVYGPLSTGNKLYLVIPYTPARSFLHGAYELVVPLELLCINDHLSREGTSNQVKVYSKATLNSISPISLCHAREARIPKEKEAELKNCFLKQLDQTVAMTVSGGDKEEALEAIHLLKLSL